MAFKDYRAVEDQLLIEFMMHIANPGEDPSRHLTIVRLSIRTDALSGGRFVAQTNWVEWMPQLMKTAADIDRAHRTNKPISKRAVALWEEFVDAFDEKELPKNEAHLRAGDRKYRPHFLGFLLGGSARMAPRYHP